MHRLIGEIRLVNVVRRCLRNQHLHVACRWEGQLKVILTRHWPMWRSNQRWLQWPSTWAEASRRSSWRKSGRHKCSASSRSRRFSRFCFRPQERFDTLSLDARSPSETRTPTNEKQWYWFVINGTAIDMALSHRHAADVRCTSWRNMHVLYTTLRFA